MALLNGSLNTIVPIYRQGKAGQLTHDLVKAPVEVGSTTLQQSSYEFPYLQPICGLGSGEFVKL